MLPRFEQPRIGWRRAFQGLIRYTDLGHAPWLQATIDRYRTQGQEPTFTAEVHVPRIGDIDLATSPFELYHDYGVQIKSRSKAVQTFVLKLTGGWGRYLPTPRAVAGGGYGAVVQSGMVGPEGGQAPVNRTVELINGLWGNPVETR